MILVKNKMAVVNRK